MRTLRVVIVIVVCVGSSRSIAAIHPKEAGTREASADVADRIRKIVDQTPYVENFDDRLFENSSMQEVTREPERFVSGIEAFIWANPDMPEVEARVSMASLQCLDLDRYLQLVERLSAAERGKVSKWVLFHSVVPGHDWSTRVAMRFRDPRIRRVLARVAQSPNASANVREAVKEILSGASARNLTRENVFPTLRCRG